MNECRNKLINGFLRNQVILQKNHGTQKNFIINTQKAKLGNLYFPLWSEKYYDLAFMSVSVSGKIYEYLLIF